MINCVIHLDSCRFIDDYVPKLFHDEIEAFRAGYSAISERTRICILIAARPYRKSVKISTFIQRRLNYEL